MVEGFFMQLNIKFTLMVYKTLLMSLIVLGTKGFLFGQETPHYILHPSVGNTIER